MVLVSVDISRYPQHADAIRRHAVRWVHGGKTAQMPKAHWMRITGRPYREPHRARRNMGDPRPDPVKDRPCCDPPE